MRIVREGWPLVGAAAAPGACIALVAGLTGSPAGVAGGAALATVAAGAMAWFFRDPPRNVPADPDALLSGADGRVMEIAEESEPEFIRGPAVRISVFLSLFDVHVNRAPIAGRIVALQHQPGRFHFAFLAKASRENERNTIVIEGAHGICIVRQIVGPVARRVVHWLEIGQHVGAGQRIGLMKFGSRLDVLVPFDSIEILVRPGMMVRAGESRLGRYRTARS
ncbi:MAG: phosphatidylserine decarboxylase [Kiritimatiellae bacterium]|nr:phosphatidylserine decarboxylase [Kiritimatiellia bacterium]